MVKRINNIRNVNLFVVGGILSPSAWLVWEVCAFSGYHVIVIAGAALFGEECHFPVRNYTHTHKHKACYVWHVIACCATTVAALCTSLWRTNALSADTPSPACKWSQHFGRPFVFHNPGKEKVECRRKTSDLQICCQIFPFISGRFTISVVSRDQSSMPLYMTKSNRNLTNESKRRKTLVKISSYGCYCQALIP